jgi:hypothetical protein
MSLLDLIFFRHFKYLSFDFIKFFTIMLSKPQRVAKAKGDQSKLKPITYNLHVNNLQRDRYQYQQCEKCQQLQW